MCSEDLKKLIQIVEIQLYGELNNFSFIWAASFMSKIRKLLLLYKKRKLIKNFIKT